MDSKICLICLRMESDDHYSIFDVDLRTPDMTILEKIRRCSDLTLIPEENEKIPSQICSRCLDDLTATWRFRKNVERLNKKYDNIVSKTNQSDTLREVQNQCIKFTSSIKRNRADEDRYLLEDEVEAHDKQFSVDFGDVIVETVSEEEIEDSVEITDYDGFEQIYGEEEILEETLHHTIEKISEPTNISKYNEEDFPHQELIENTNEGNEGKHRNVLKNKYRWNKNPKKIVDGEYKRKLDSQGDSGQILRDNEVEELLDENSGSDNVKQCKKNKKTSTPKICDICGNSYKYQHALNAHMRRHTNERPFRCEFCEKSFVAGVEMQRHMRVHTGQKPYSCKHCDRKFSDFGSRVKHERTHTGERPYICSTCGKTFAYAHVLTVHLRTHTGEKKFQCTICEKGFTKKVYLQSHMHQHSNCGLTTGNSHDSGNKSVKLEEFVIGEYVDDGKYADPTSFVKSETISPEDGDFKYIITVQ